LVLLWCDLAIWAGFFAVMPYLPERLTSLGHSGTVVGLVLAVRLLCQQGTMPVSGALADRLGHRRTLLYGLGLRAGGFGCMALATGAPALALAAALSGVGGSLLGAAFKGTYSVAPGGADLAARFLWLALVDRLGQAVGPLLSRQTDSFAAKGFLGVGLVLATATVVWRWVPESRTHTADQPLWEQVRRQWRNRRLAGLVALLCGYWALHQQMAVLIPLAAVRTGLRQEVGTLFSLSAMVGLLLVLWLPRVRVDRLWSRLWLAQGLTALSMAMPLLWPGSGGVLAVTLGLAVAAVLGQPAIDALVGLWSPPDARGSAYGFAALSFGVGGAAGQVVGGWVWSRWSEAAPWLPWLLFSTVGWLTLVGLYLLKRGVRPHDQAA
jgi:MFS transporter, DHA1 family, multidrug resistance protein